MLNIKDIATLQDYARGVAGRAAHHASNISEVIPVVLGNVLLHGTKFSMRGPGKNVAWFETAKDRYAVAYSRRANHNYLIEIRRGSQQGPVALSCDNTTPTPTINADFRAL